MTAADRAEAREYLKKELIGLKRRDALMLTSHLRKLQRREKRRLEIEQGKRTSKNLDDWDDEEDVPIGMNKLPVREASLLPAEAFPAWARLGTASRGSRKLLLHCST